MSDKLHPNWKPSPELLAAYADGELDARDDSDELRDRIETWLTTNPSARADLAANLRLKSLWDKSTPPEPSREAWRETVNRIENRPAPAPVSPPSAKWFVVGATLAACGLWAILLASHALKTPPASVEPFAVASNSDVEILHVEGDAVNCLVVGLLPLDGVLNLADPGEVIITSITPAHRDNMLPTVHVDRRPMIWAKANGEAE